MKFCHSIFESNISIVAANDLRDFLIVNNEFHLRSSDGMLPQLVHD